MTIYRLALSLTLCLFIALNSAILIAAESTPRPLALADEAQQLFNTHQNSILQIRVIELTSGNKASIGSGFLINNSGLIATNFHVISNSVHYPDRYRLEYIKADNTTGHLKIVDIDVIHDLAIVSSDINDSPPLVLGNSNLSKGTKIFSLGNPHDLGLSIVEGTYNGLLEKSLFDKIFFSGSLNPGMSGGPTLNRQGQVVGINVSTAGNQLSFLVPVNYLKTLANNANEANHETTRTFDKRIEQQLQQHQSLYLEKLIASPWPTTQFGPFTLPGQISAVVKCWGNSDDNPKALIDHTVSNCFSEDRIFLSQRFTTGGFAYTYDLYTNKNLSSIHFYNLYDTDYGRALRVNTADKEAVSDYTCHTDFVSLNKKDWKIAYCARNYIKYPSLFDVTVAIAMISDKHQGLIVKLAIAGVDKQTATAFTRKFIHETQRGQPVVNPTEKLSIEEGP